MQIAITVYIPLYGTNYSNPIIKNTKKHLSLLQAITDSKKKQYLNLEIQQKLHTVNANLQRNSHNVSFTYS